MNQEKKAIVALTMMVLVGIVASNSGDKWRFQSRGSPVYELVVRCPVAPDDSTACFQEGANLANKAGVGVIITPGQYLLSAPFDMPEHGVSSE
jgi:hypothetical protein